MKYILIWCAGLNVFALEGPDMQRKTYTEAELREKFQGNATLIRWLEFSKEHAGVEVVYDMLPA